MGRCALIQAFGLGWDMAAPLALNKSRSKMRWIPPQKKWEER
jgi:hypothetical protein